jgi:hypothetical protein
MKKEIRQDNSKKLITKTMYMFIRIKYHKLNLESD